MDILILLDKLDDLIYNSKQIPLTDQVRVEREEAYALLDQIRVTLPEEIKQARWIVKERQELHEEEPDSRHLREIAHSIEELKRAQRPAPPPLTAAAGERVRSIVEAAEASATEVRAEAEREARRIEEDAARRGMEMRKRNAAEAAARLKRADEVNAALLAEAGAASADMEALLDRVRGPATVLADVLGESANALRADFDRMRARVAEGVDEAPAPTSLEAHPAPAIPAEPVAEEADELSQPTEEWSYEEPMVAADADDDGTFAASLPGPDAHVSAGRLTGPEESFESEDGDGDGDEPVHDLEPETGHSSPPGGSAHDLHR